jgi:hypothetical protein
MNCKIQSGFYTTVGGVLALLLDHVNEAVNAAENRLLAVVGVASVVTFITVVGGAA